MTSANTILSPHDVVTCTAVRHTPYSSDKQRVNHCGKPSTYRVEGNPYCTIHAGQAALAILINGEEK